MCRRAVPLLLALLASPAMAVAPAISIPAAQAPATQAQIAALQQAVQNAQSAGDNAWMLVSAALVLLMTGPGLALFYGGLVRRKNILGTMMQSFAMMGLVTVLWAIVGYSLAFGHGNVLHRRLRAPLPARRRAHSQSRLRRHHSRADLHDLPAHVRHHHPGAHHRRLCRAHEVQRHGRLSLPLVALRLLPHGPHGLGRRRPAQRHRRPHSQPRLRRRHRRPHHQRRLRAGLLPLSRQAHRLPADRHAAPLHGAQLHRRLPAVGGLVRLQRRQRPGRQPAGHQRLRQHPLRRRRRRHRLDHRRVDSQRQAHRPGRHLRRGRRTGRHHPGLRLRSAHVARWLIGLVAGVFCFFMVFQVKSLLRLRRLARRLRRPRRRRNPRRPAHRPLRRQRHQPDLRQAASPTGAIDGHWGQVLNQLAGVGIAWGISIVGTLVLLFVVDKIIGLRVSPEDEAAGLDLSQHGEEGYDFNS